MGQVMCSHMEDTQLHVAVKKKYSGCIVKLMLQCGCSADSEDTSGRTPLHVALEYKCSPDVVKIVANNTTDINTADNNGNTPLHTAIKSKAPLQVIECLLTNQANVDAFDEEENTALHLALPLAHSPENAHKLTEILVKRMSSLNRENKFGETVLHIAIKYVLPHKIINLLIAHGADSAICNCWGATALHYCMLYCKESVDLIPMAQSLLKNENLDINAQEYSGNTALHVAVQNGLAYDMITLLCQHGADRSLQNNMGRTPLHYVKTVKLLEFLFTRRDWINIQDKRLSTPLHNMVKAKVPPGMLQKAIHYGCNPNMQDNEGKTPLHLAIFNSTSRRLFLTVKYLLHSNQSINAADKNHDTALHIAVRKHVSKDVIHMLLDSGSDPDLQNKQGCTPLQEFYNIEALDFREVSLMLQKSQKVNVVDPKTGSSFLHRFIYDFCSVRDPRLYPKDGLDLDTFTGFLHYGLDPNITTRLLENTTYTPLMTILNSPKRNKQMIQLLTRLLEAGANPNMPNNSKNQTALEIYCINYFELESVLPQPKEVRQNQEIFFRESVSVMLRAGFCIKNMDSHTSALLIENFALEEYWLKLMYYYGMSFERVAREADKHQLIAIVLSELNFQFHTMTLFELAANVLRVHLRPNCYHGLELLKCKTSNGFQLLPNPLKSKIITCIEEIPLNSIL